MDPKYHLVAGVAAFTGLPSVKIYSLDEESKASVKAQLFMIFIEYGNPKPLIFTGTMDEIRGKLRQWCKENDYVYEEKDVENNQLAITIKVNLINKE